MEDAMSTSTERRSVTDGCDLGDGTDVAEFSVLKNVTAGRDCTIWRFVNAYGCVLGDDVMVGSNVEIQRDAKVGDRSRIQSHAFVCSLVDIGPDCFVSHGAKFINDRHPPAGDSDKWEATEVGPNVAIGTNATVLPVSIGPNAMVGAGAVVTEDVPADAIVAGNPAEIVGWRGEVER
ncbi:MAG: acyltransferase [Candidatus Wenzhouxiangella sp. M2_3B_020]